MKARELVKQVPASTGNALQDLQNLRAALVRILQQLDDIAPAVGINGDFLIGNQPLSSTATHGFLYIPVIDGSGPPLGTPQNYGAGDPIVRTRDDDVLWVYDFVGKRWKSIPETEDDNEILELLLLIKLELELHREL